MAASEVTSVLDRLEEGFAVIQLAGTVHGMVDGTATELEIRANYAFDIERTMVVRFHLALKEKRALGDVTPGVEAVAKLNMKITPLESSGQLTDEIAAAMAESKPLDEVSLLYENAQQGVRFRYGPKWYVTSERRDVLALRLIGDSAVVASCNISRLPAHAEGRETTLEQFQKDVRFALGDHFERFVSTRHWSTSAGLKCISVVARGLVNEIPIRWRYYLVFNETGQRLSLATTVHESLMDQLADADLELVETMQLGPGTRAAQRSASPETR